jgi:hypothetical protein
MEKTFICLFDLRPYDNQVAPALRKYARDYDPSNVVALLRKVRELLPELTRDTARPLLTQEDYEHWIVSVAPDAGYKPSEQTLKELSELLVQPLCVPAEQDFHPMQDISPLSDWLSQRSEWFADLMEGGEELAGGRLEFSFGSGSLVATREQIAQFLQQVKQTPAPAEDQSGLLKEYRNLLKLLETAAADKNLTLLKTTIGASDKPAG